ncbi:Zinc finger protein 830-like protein [Rhynchospora pubera]|uniref:Zinc finger protein 830-like protein n=1 Tax=Rhynchospora pubera TaxID=906938 RepID=A0AAV8C5Z5_9POAL|nr:Zinc finger protein 830-like protein [Rhynchospora pubera]
MDQRKALFRAKLRESEQKKDKRIDSPLVRYNEHGQPICKVCNITLKSDSLWPAHQVSRKHHEAIENLKAAAAEAKNGKSLNNGQQPKIAQKSQVSSSLPANFFETKQANRQQSDINGESVKASSSFDEPMHVSVPVSSNKKTDKKAENSEFKIPKNVVPAKRARPDDFYDDIPEEAKLAESNQVNQPDKPEKGALPEGFFDNKDADLRARGIQPVKVDINDAYKEFEKEIQDDLQEVDNRLEEEEIDAAEEQEEFLTLEQREYREKVDLVKQKLVETKASRLARVNQKPAFDSKESSSDDSSSDDGEDFAVDWRAQHL